ncbi:MAG: hypothetical protein ACREVS_12115, partial [Burkholderiales bacterium]
RELVTRIARLVRDGELPEPLVVHTRRVTWLWAVSLALMAAVSAVLARFAEPATWSWRVAAGMVGRAGEVFR